MRITLSLDDDVANLLKEEMRRSGSSLGQTVNGLLRLGLVASGSKARKPFVVTPLSLGLPHGMSYDNVEDLIEALEGPAHT